MNRVMKEFRDFAIRGNVVDMAIGIILGGAFGKIVSSLVSDVIMPPIGMLMGNADFSDLFIVLGPGSFETLEEAKTAGAATLNYGLFINNVVSFAIVAFSAFLLVKATNLARKREEQAPKVPPPTPRQEVLLQEIRDLLKDGR